MTIASKRDGGDFTVYQIDARGDNQQSVGGSRTALLPSSQQGAWYPPSELPPWYRTVYGDTTAFNGKRQLAVLVPQAPIRDRLLTSNANDYQPAISSMARK